MKYQPKPLLAALTLAAGGAQAANIGQAFDLPRAGAQLTLHSGVSELKFNPGFSFDGRNPDFLDGLIYAWNVANIQVSAIAPGATTMTHAESDFGEVIRVGVTTKSPVTSLKVDPLTGQVLTVESAGGTRQTGTRINGTLIGGRADVTNLRFDLANKVVYADLAGRSNGIGTRPAVDYVLNNTAVWTFETVTGLTNFPVDTGNFADFAAAMAASSYEVGTNPGGGYYFRTETVISRLRVTEAGFDFFKNALWLNSTGIDNFRRVNEDFGGWGSISVKMVITAVPEPSTWGLALAGLLVAGAAAARQQRKG